MKLLGKFAVPVIIFLIILFGGAYIYSQVEDWRYLDSLYFVVSTVTTIGYGDFTPQTDTGKIITLFFPFIGIGMAFYFLGMIGKYIMRKQIYGKLESLGRIKNERGVHRVR